MIFKRIFLLMITFQLFFFSFAFAWQGEFFNDPRISPLPGEIKAKSSINDHQLDFKVKDEKNLNTEQFFQKESKENRISQEKKENNFWLMIIFILIILIILFFFFVIFFNFLKLL